MSKFLMLFLTVLMLSSCMLSPSYRTVEIEIPDHPWEKYSDNAIWYNVCWMDGKEIQTVHADAYTRNLCIRIPTGKTVFICAYPIGEMLPFGCVVTPLDTKTYFLLNQNDGILADLFLNADSDAVGTLNYPMLKEKASGMTTDFASLDLERLLKDTLNGKLKGTSVTVLQNITIPPFDTVSGTWISERVQDGRIVFPTNRSVELSLPKGIHRFLNAEKNLELRIVVESENEIYHYERTPLVSERR